MQIFKALLLSVSLFSALNSAQMNVLNKNQFLVSTQGPNMANLTNLADNTVLTEFQASIEYTTYTTIQSLITTDQITNLMFQYYKPTYYLSGTINPLNLPTAASTMNIIFTQTINGIGYN